MSGPLSHPPGKDKGTIRRGSAGVWGSSRIIAETQCVGRLWKPKQPYDL